MITLALVALISVVVTFIIVRFDQKRQIRQTADRAYNQGFDDGRITTVPPAVRDEDKAPWEQPAFYRKEAYPAPAPVYAGPSKATVIIQDEVDQFCKDMDNDTALFLAHLEADGHRTMALATRDFSREDPMTAPISVIARETQTITREVIVRN